MQKLTRLLIDCIFLLAGPGYTLAEEPEPFRRDEMGGRDFDYSEMSFLHRYSYRLRPGWINEWQVNPSGFRITAGSVTTEELYVQAELRKRFDFSELVFGEIRFWRNEDFDTRYDRFLTGLGVNFWNNWSFGVYSDIVAEKEDVDLQFELAWRDHTQKSFSNSQEPHSTAAASRRQDRFRLVFSLIDQFFNQKAEEGRYQDRPFNVFAEYLSTIGQSGNLYLWLNLSPELHLEFEEDNGKYEYQQFAAGTRVSLPVSDATSIYVTARGESGERDYGALVNQTDQTPQKFPLQDLERRNSILELELTHQVTPTFQIWSGARYFFLSEKNGVESTERFKGELIRREPIVFSGILYRYSDNLVFWPGVYLDFLNNSDDTTRSDNSTSPRDSKDSNLVGKVALPVEYQLPEHQAKIIFDPTLEFPRRIFGGFNVQVQFGF